MKVTSSKLGDILSLLRNGLSVKQDKVAAGLPITRIETIWNSTIDLNRVGYADIHEGTRSDYLLKPNDILFSHINSLPHLGKCAIYEGLPPKLIHGMNLLNLRVDPSKASPRYLLHYLRSADFRRQLLPRVNQSVNQVSVSISALKTLDIPLPPLPEQRRIAAILDKADAIGAKRQEAIHKLDTLLQSVFVEMFGDPAKNCKGWPSATLGELVRSNDKINYGVVQPGEDVPNGIPIVRVGDLRDGFVDTSHLKRISADIERTYSRSRLQGDEILLSCVGSIGVVAHATEEVKGYNIARAVARIPVSANLERFYIAEYLRSDYSQNYFKKETRTVSQPTLNIGLIEKLPILIPPFDSQKEFAAIAERTTALRRRLISSLEHLEEFQRALQARFFDQSCDK